MNISPSTRQTLGSLNQIAQFGTGSTTRSAEWVFHVSGTWTGTIQTKAWISGGGLTATDRQPIPYSGKSGALTDPSATGITTNGIYKVPVSAGEIIILEMTAFTSGTALIDGCPSPLA